MIKVGDCVRVESKNERYNGRTGMVVRQTGPEYSEGHPSNVFVVLMDDTAEQFPFFYKNLFLIGPKTDEVETVTEIPADALTGDNYKPGTVILHAGRQRTATKQSDGYWLFNHEDRKEYLTATDTINGTFQVLHDPAASAEW